MDDEKKSKSNNNDPLIGRVLFNKYLLVKKLGEGSFGCIYSAKENNCWYAIKFENKNKGQNLLENEAYIMSYLSGQRIPTVKSFGYSGEYNVLIMELMGKSLEDLFENLPNKKMSIRCVCNLGYQMIEIMEYIHNKHIIHRDIKPDNFVMGKGTKSKYLFLLDFGLSKKYRSSSTLKHYPLIIGKKLTGTARYASVNALNGVTQSRRDDLEAVGYVLMYFLLGKLPWQGMVNRNKNERYLKIMQVKRDTTPEQLCKGFPPEFEKYVSYTRNLEYEQDPDYEFLKNLFLKVLKDEGYNLDYYYDWDNDIVTMSTIDTNQNFIFKNEVNNMEKNLDIKQLNQKNLRIEEEEEKNENNETLNKKGIEENKDNENKNDNNIIEKKEENKNIEKKEEINNTKKNEEDNKSINKKEEKKTINNENDIDNDNKKINIDFNNNINKNNEDEIKFTLGLEEYRQKVKKVRKKEKYAICGYKNNVENSCCFII